MSSNREDSNDNLCSCFKAIYKKYIPTNRKTYNLAIAIFGFALSCFAFGFFMRFDMTGNSQDMFNYGFMAIAAACSIELYCGLQDKISTQFMFWILLKLLEISAVLAQSVNVFVFRRGKIIGALEITLIIIQLMLVSYVVRRAIAKDNREDPPEANIYDNVPFCSFPARPNQPEYSNV